MKKQVKSQGIQKVLDYIESHLDEELTLDVLAQHTGYSKFHLSRLFAREVGCTIIQHIQTLRLQRAAQQLRDTSAPIIEIALGAGYASQQSFTLAFRQVFHATPKQYRIHSPACHVLSIKNSMTGPAALYHLYCGRAAA